MRAIDKLGCDLYQVIVIQSQIFLKLVSSSNVDRPIRDTEVEDAAFVEIMLDTKSLQDKGSFEASTDVKDRILW